MVLLMLLITCYWITITRTILPPQHTLNKHIYIYMHHYHRDTHDIHHQTTITKHKLTIKQWPYWTTTTTTTSTSTTSTSTSTTYTLIHPSNNVAHQCPKHQDRTPPVWHTARVGGEAWPMVASMWARQATRWAVPFCGGEMADEW